MTGIANMTATAILKTSRMNYETKIVNVQNRHFKIPGFRLYNTNLQMHTQFREWPKYPYIIREYHHGKISTSYLHIFLFNTHPLLFSHHRLPPTNKRKCASTPSASTTAGAETPISNSPTAARKPSAPTSNVRLLST
jgi:hypothetical protein